MNQLDFTFEAAPWELLLDKQRPDTSLSAVRLLTALEGEEEEAVEDAFAALEQKRIALDVSQLPADWGTAQTADRLRMEAQLVKNKDYFLQLPDSDPLRLYLEELAAIPAAGDPQLLAQEYAAGNTELMQRLVDASIGRAVACAEEMTGRGVLLLDLIQEASLGLWQGILQYTGGDYAAHTDWWIRQYLARAILLQARERGTGSKMQTVLENYRKADQQLLVELGRNPTREEIAGRIGITAEDAQIYEDMLRTAQLLEKATRTPEADPVEEERAVEDTAYFQSRQRIQEMLSTLDALQTQVLTLRFGLDGKLPATPQETAAKLGITADRVIEIEAGALQKLRAEG